MPRTALLREDDERSGDLYPEPTESPGSQQGCFPADVDGEIELQEPADKKVQEAAKLMVDQQDEPRSRRL